MFDSRTADVNNDEDRDRKVIDSILQVGTVSMANATINTTVEAQNKAQHLLDEPSPEKTPDPSPKMIKPAGVSLEKMESLTAMAFDPKKAKPRPKRSSLLIK